MHLRLVGRSVGARAVPARGTVIRSRHGEQADAVLGSCSLRLETSRGPPEISIPLETGRRAGVETGNPKPKPVEQLTGNPFPVIRRINETH